MNSKILIIKHNSNEMKLIQEELKKGMLISSLKLLKQKRSIQRHCIRSNQTIILSNYTIAFDGLTALKIREKLVPQTPFIFVSESIDHENTKGLIK